MRKCVWRLDGGDSRVVALTCGNIGVAVWGTAPPRLRMCFGERGMAPGGVI
ncbi:hypothetical protein [Streptomyces sp. NPDC047985]|uniref:hypothetical protein n=1 Tax=Streptomyces sp. NPDC047985 TaxID=3155384 RepID=UPI003413D70B